MLYGPLLCFALSGYAAGSAAQPDGQAPPEPKPAPVSQPATTPGSTAPRVESIPLPDDAVLVVVERAADALRMVPNAIFLKPEKYQQLIAELDRLRKQSGVDRPASPSRCELKGKVAGGTLALQAQFQFVTERPQSVIWLGCRQARADDVTLDDGRKPLLRSDPSEGFTVTVDKPGEHRLTLDLSSALVGRGTRQGIEMDLPRAATTKLDLELPEGIRDLRLGPGAKVSNNPLLNWKGNVLKGSLPASADRLDLSWTGPGTGPGALTVRGRIEVSVDEQQIATRAELFLERQGGEADTWRVLVPTGATVKVSAEEEDQLVGIDSDDKTYGPYASLQTVRLKNPVPSIRLLVSSRAPSPRPGVTAPIGPFAAPGATREEGTLQISNSARGLRLSFRRRAELTREAAQIEKSPSEATQVDTFHYASVPQTDRPNAAAGPNSLSLLDIEAEAPGSLVETRCVHALQLVRDATGARRWHLKTRIEATPSGSLPKQMRVQLPPGFRYAREFGSADSVSTANVLSTPLQGADANGFLRTIEGDYLAVVPDTGKATLALPRPLETRDSGGQVVVSAPEDLELLPLERGNPGMELIARDGQSQTWRSASSPERIEVAWRAFRPELVAWSDIDLTLTPGEGRIRHRLRFRFPRLAPDQIALHVPLAVSSHLRVVQGGSLATREFLGPAVRVIDLRSPGEPAPGKDVTLVIEYSFARHEGRTPAGTLSIPLVQPEMAARGETKVRVWSEPGAAPLPPGGVWSEENIEEVQGQDRLPALVLRAQRLDAPLTLPLAPPDEPWISVLPERALVRVYVAETGSQSYRAGFLLERLESRFLDVELPAAAAGVNLRLTLDGKQLSWEAVDEEGHRAAGGRIARSRLGPQLVKRGSILEVAYDLQPGRATTGLLQTTLNPPVLRNDPGRVPTRWLVQLPSGWLPIGPDGGPSLERNWTRRGWLFVPHPSVTDADLERWLAGPAASAARGPDESAVPSLTCWRDRPEPLCVIHAPREGWLLACSLGTLALGLSVLALSRRGRNAGAARWLLPGAAVLGAGLAAGSLLWPSLMAAVAYGSQPGLAVLAIMCPLAWLQHERQRRRQAFSTTFSYSRGAARPSRLQTNGARGPGEPSTVDAPGPNGGSARSSPEVQPLEGSEAGKSGREPQGTGGPGS